MARRHQEVLRCHYSGCQKCIKLGNILNYLSARKLKYVTDEEPMIHNDLAGVLQGTVLERLLLNIIYSGVLSPSAPCSSSSYSKKTIPERKLKIKQGIKKLKTDLDRLASLWPTTKQKRS